MDIIISLIIYHVIVIILISVSTHNVLTDIQLWVKEME